NVVPECGRRRPLPPPAHASTGGRLTDRVTQPTWRRPNARRVRTFRNRLRPIYGTPGWGAHGHPIAELILTVLSQSTNARNRDVAYLRLRERFADWEAIRAATVA